MLDRPALYTDYYELTMAQGYFLEGRENEQACFDYFFRRLPYEGGYAVSAGLVELLETLENFHFHQEELDYLQERGFTEEFLHYLSTLDLDLEIKACKEGELIFPTEPLARIQGNLIHAQLIETLLLNTLNFQSLIATKACRIKDAAGGRTALEFGLRRAQGLGGIQATRAAAIGGVQPTSNVYASRRYNIQASGTMAHSWIQSFEDELTAFRTYARHYPDKCILLVDTYDTLNSGIPNAITVAKELEEQGHRLIGIRLDSGDLAYLSRKAREKFDDAGLSYVKIAASNQLDEQVIKSLLNQNAAIDIFGVGTRLATGQPNAAFDGVYKLVSINNEPKLKKSENIEKITLPGLKNLYRYTTHSGKFVGDGILLEGEAAQQPIYHPYLPEKFTDFSAFEASPLLETFMKGGKIIQSLPSIVESAEYLQERFSMLNEGHKRFHNPHVYKVGISKKLMNLRNTLLKKASQAHKNKNS